MFLVITDAPASGGVVRKWRNWQTRKPQELVAARSWRFAALRIVTDALRSCIRDGDLLFRWGGDEFVGLLERETEAGGEARFARLNEKLRRLKLPGMDAEVDLSVSVGLVAFDGPASLDDAIALADEAMYRRKKTA